ncbi:MAG TPA: MFS transporter [Gemmataceae bacterium]|nr:MFS transporter [Gemmataceae bacterium]
MSPPSVQDMTRGKWLALAAALLGWMFDGLEQGLFPLVGRTALRSMGIPQESEVGVWFAVATAGFLVGAASGGVLFGWLGDRIGRVRAMTLSVLTYAIFSGLCGVATGPRQIACLRFCAALGMGGEWSLGVALVMEIWPDRSRALLAGLIGAAANVGFLLCGAVNWGLGQSLPQIESGFARLGLPDSWTSFLVANSGWRLLMFTGAAPALLTFFIRLFVPESQRWLHEQKRGATSHWATRDLLGVGIGTAAAVALIYLWGEEIAWTWRVVGSVLALAIVTLGYLYPVFRYLQRGGSTTTSAGQSRATTIRRMLLGACLSGVALLGTWASMQWVPTWVDQLTGGQAPDAKSYAQMCGALGAIAGTIAAALLGNWWNRRPTYCFLCAGSLAAALLLFQANSRFGVGFLFCVFLAGMFTASFYGWLPLYLPELFHTGVRATCQGFSYNFGRILAAVGVLQTGSLTRLFKGDYPKACSIMSLIYVVGLVIVWLAPETRGKPLPD